MPISGHFRDCKALLVVTRESDSCIASTRPLPFPFDCVVHLYCVLLVQEVQACSAVLGEIALVQAISPIATRFSVAWSVSLSVICHIRAACLNRWTDLHATWQVQLRGPLTHCVRSRTSKVKGDLGDSSPSQNLHLRIRD